MAIIRCFKKEFEKIFVKENLMYMYCECKRFFTLLINYELLYYQNI